MSFMWLKSEVEDQFPREFSSHAKKDIDTFCKEEELELRNWQAIYAMMRPRVQSPKYPYCDGCYLFMVYLEAKANKETDTFPAHRNDWKWTFFPIGEQEKIKRPLNSHSLMTSRLMTM